MRLALQAIARAAVFGLAAGLIVTVTGQFTGLAIKLWPYIAPREPTHHCTPKGPQQ